VIDLEPRCDECGIHCEEVDVDEWCGECGCCADHCAGFEGCPPIYARRRLVGTRVRVVGFAVEPGGHNDNEIVPPGTCGTVRSVDDSGTIHVNWDNGRNLGLLHSDQWEHVHVIGEAL
jgi:hypothetical protein